jgi:hypothetical protein
LPLGLNPGESYKQQHFIILDHTVNGNKDKMAKTKRRMKRREWTKENLRELKAHSRSKTPVAEISKLTKRTVGSLRQKALHMGLSLGHRR